MFLLTEDCHIRKDSERELFMPTLLAVRCHSFDSNFHMIWYTVQTYSAHINLIYFCHFRVSQRSTGMWQMVIKSDYTCSGVRFHLSCHLVHSNEDWLCSVSSEWCEPNLSFILQNSGRFYQSLAWACSKGSCSLPILLAVSTAFVKCLQDFKSLINHAKETLHSYQLPSSVPWSPN